MKETIILLILLLSHAFAQNKIYVSNLGNDHSGSGSFQQPFKTIQYAIDQSINGDIIIVEEGKYKGPGNYNINFLGKKITLTSKNPDDFNCVENTIIDAEGAGVIVMFVNDEGPETEFRGFSLLAGDAKNIRGRGVPGFFEFSTNARPVTSDLYIKEDSTSIEGIKSLHNFTIPKSNPGNNQSSSNRNDPYSQPVMTTDYYGSGDVDNDCTFSIKDVNVAREMAAGLIEPSIRADTDGNGIINENDIMLITSATSGASLPAWWNKFTKREERNSWINKILSIDRTDEHPYDLRCFICADFSFQLYVNTSFIRKDLSCSHYNGGQTIFNIPNYDVKVFVEDYGHAINAILVGDDPLNFDDWRFLEPQNDSDVYPGMWNMPYGSNICICAYEKCNNPSGMTLELYFKLGSKEASDKSGWELVFNNPNLLLTRPTEIESSISNLPDLWNPRFVPGKKNMLLFERTRDDMTRITDIHLSTEDSPEGIPLINSNQYSRLIDIVRANEEEFYILWKGKPDFVPGVFCGKLNINSRIISEVQKVSVSNSYRVLSGRLIVTKEGYIHAFWYTRENNGNNLYSRGIYWASLQNSEWQTEKNILSFSNNDDSEADPYRFNVTQMGNGDILLAVANEKITIIRYNGNWQTPIRLDNLTKNIREIDILSDSNNLVHIVYTADFNLFHITSSDGFTWPGPSRALSLGSTSPYLIAGDDDQLFLTYVGSNSNTVAWRKYENFTWSSQNKLDIRSGANAQYPKMELYPDNSLEFIWTSISSDLITIESATITDMATSFEKTLDVPEYNYSLEQNFPNPFNPITQINYSLADKSDVKLIIYDVLGNEILRLVNKIQPAGNYAVTFDARSLASGVYFYKINTGKFSDTKKCLVIK